MKKLSLKSLEVKSFVTTISNSKDVKGGATLPVVCQNGQLITINACLTGMYTQGGVCG